MCIYLSPFISWFYLFLAQSSSAINSYVYIRIIAQKKKEQIIAQLWNGIQTIKYVMQSKVIYPSYFSMSDDPDFPLFFVALCT